jgi:hypothetical protein
LRRIIGFKVKEGAELQAGRRGGFNSRHVLGMLEWDIAVFAHSQAQSTPGRLKGMCGNP